MKKLTYYNETKQLLEFIAENWPEHNPDAIKTILADVKREIEERNIQKMKGSDQECQDTPLLEVACFMDPRRRDRCKDCEHLSLVDSSPQWLCSFGVSLADVEWVERCPLLDL